MSWTSKIAISKNFSCLTFNEVHGSTVENLFWHKQIIEKCLFARRCYIFVSISLLPSRSFQSRENLSCTHSLTISNNHRANPNTTSGRAPKKGKQSSKQGNRVSKKEKLRETRKRSFEANETVKGDSDIKANKSFLYKNTNAINIPPVDSPDKFFSLPEAVLPEAKTKHLKGGTENPGEHGCNGRHEVRCEVQIISWRERRISASICIEATEDRVWNVLTDYERLAEFIPNLVRSERIPCPHPGHIWLLQRGIHTAMYWHIEASVVLDLQEFLHSVGGKELHFSMVDGDFKLYAGRWLLQPGSKFGTTVLHYEVNVIPRLLFPAAFVEKIIKADLPVNLCAIAERAEADPALWYACPNISKSVALMPPMSQSFSGESVGVPLLKAAFHHNPEGSKTFGKKNSFEIPASAVLHDKACLPIRAYSQEINKLGSLVTADRKWNRIRRTGKVNRALYVDEVHLRRLNDSMTNGQHWRVITAITVEAPTEDVWAVLTAYENLPEFIPNLSRSKVLFKEENHVRILQEGCKYLLCMALHARVVLDLSEKPKFEITFQQVEGDFDSFYGRWTLDPLGNQHTLLKYVVDMRIHKDILLPETIVEEVVYEDLPENLSAIRDQVEFGQAGSIESLKQAQEVSEDSKNDPDASLNATDELGSSVNLDTEKFTSKKRKKRGVPVAGLQRDFRVLQKELLKFIAENGKAGVMPMRWELRQSGRIDLEKAIARMGGFIRVAAHLGISLTYKQRKPKGYWDNLENIRHEILHFQNDSGKETNTMPTRRSLEKAGRYDLARALEKWGGLMEVTQLLGLKTRRNTTLNRDKFSKLEETATHDASGKKVSQDATSD